MPEKISVLPPREEEGEKETPQESKELQPEDRESKEKEPHYDAAIVFGFGVLSPENQKTPDEKKWQLSFGARLRLDAAVALYKMGQVREIFVSEGGKGAETMKKYLIEYWGLPDGVVKEEAHATNTLENFAHTINMLDGEKEKAETTGEPEDYKYGNLAFISSGFHTERIKQLARLFEFEGNTVSAEEMIKHAVRSDVEDFKEKTLEHAEFEQDEETDKKVWKPTEHNPKETGFNFGEMKSRAYDPNRPQYQEWLQAEDKWVLPIIKHGWEDYFLQNIAIVNPARLRDMIADNKNIQKFILKNGDLTKFLQEKGIDTDEKELSENIRAMGDDDMEEFRKQLRQIDRLKSPIFKAKREEIEKQWREYFETQD
ncbi:YdcF family protein [Patescibacteria group bacterium]|nr:YdcF family protein [Patescibacteria group bacterium]MBU4512382.1 YdcF family protein [Patescibacteria group bacterium]MCG2692491.1 YdcF family protein [Candidatus Parcubacteria bacterium]